MMVSMAEEHRDGSAEVEGSTALRIESPAIAWSSGERDRAHFRRGIGGSTALAVLAIGAAVPLDSGLLAGLGMIAVAMAGGGALWYSAGGIQSLRGAAKAGVIECDGDALLIDCEGRRERVGLDEVQEGWLEDIHGQADLCDVVLRLRSGRDVAVRVRGRVAGESLLRTIGVSVTDRALRMPLRSLASSQRFGEMIGITSLALVLLSLFAGGGGLVWFVIMYLRHGSPINDTRGLAILVSLLVALSVFSLAGVRLLSRFLRRGEVVVGTDGVALEGVGRRRFIAYARVSRIARDPRGVRLYLKDGVSVLLPSLADANAPLPVTAGVDAAFDPASVKRGIPHRVSVEALFRQDVIRREALFARIDQAMRARGRSRVSHVQLAQLDRRSRSVPAWREDLRALLAVEGSGYRGAALGPDQLAEVVEDAGAPTERRVAAAVALSGKGDEEARRRVRVAVEACADQDLRAALEHAAEGEIEEAELHRAMKQRREPVG
jgi:hypothetical protein